VVCGSDSPLTLLTPPLNRLLIAEQRTSDFHGLGREVQLHMDTYMYIYIPGVRVPMAQLFDDLLCSTARWQMDFLVALHRDCEETHPKDPGSSLLSGVVDDLLSRMAHFRDRETDTGNPS
jgi:hypothetical protein